MIEKHYGAFILVCDYCGGESVEFDTFQDAVDGKNKFGWKSKRAGNEWHDVCPECQEGE